MAGNIDAMLMPWWSKEELDAEISRQVQKAKGAHGFIISTGSPFPGDAPLHTLTRFMAAGRQYAEGGNGSAEIALQKA